MARRKLSEVSTAFSVAYWKQQLRRSDSTLAYQFAPGGCQFSAKVEEVAGWPKDRNVVFEPKLDGLRYLLQVCPNESDFNFLTSRRISEITGNYVEKQDMEPKMRDFKFPAVLNGSIFDGEIYSTGLSSDTQHDMSIGNSVYWVFDVIKGGPLMLAHKPFAERRLHLQLLSRFFPPWMKLIPQHFDAEKLLDQIRIQGGEGIVRKSLDLPYGFGWTKVKWEETHDVVICGYEESKAVSYAKYGWIQNVKFGQWVDKKLIVKNNWHTRMTEIKGAKALVEMGKTSGFDNATRKKLSENKTKFLGSVIEVCCNQRLKSGKLRHPRFIRFRFDKNSEDCIFKPKE